MSSQVSKVHGKKIRTVCAVSDLHMFCRRSQWEAHLEQIYDAAKDVDLFVFNGDTVDFKWSTLPTVDETVRQTIDFFRDFANRFVHCHVHVNLGNHDHVQPFMDALEEEAGKLDNFSWHPYYLRVGNALFLHGDVANYRMTHQQLQRYRRRWNTHGNRQQSDLKNRVYDAAFRAKAHLAVSRIAFPHKRTVQRVAAYLEDIDHTREHGVERVYFGHTHVPISGYKHNGVVFHNGGAPMEGMGFTLLKAEL